MFTTCNEDVGPMSRGSPTPVDPTHSGVSLSPPCPVTTHPCLSPVDPGARPGGLLGQVTCSLAEGLAPGGTIQSLGRAQEAGEGVL